MLKHYHTSGHSSWWKRAGKGCDVAGGSKPYAIVRAVHDVLERARQMLEAVRPADNVGMKCDAHDQRTPACILHA